MRNLWNRPSLSVWSLATVDEHGRGNMNICTYVTSISMDPKLMLVAVYHGTKTHENISATKKVLLQLLSQEQAPLTRLCGHTSGKATDKMARLQKKTPVATVDGIPYMTQCAGYVILEVQ